MGVILLLPIAILASATAFPVMLWQQPLPEWPTKERLERGMLPTDWYKRPYHFLKNITTECFRADPQWWSKCMSFVGLSLTIGVILK